MAISVDPPLIHQVTRMMQSDIKEQLQDFKGVGCFYGF